MSEADAKLAAAMKQLEAERAAKFAKLRAPFEPDEIELLPKPFKKDAPKSKCEVCGGYHGQPAVHLSYVGHAGITMRLLDVDPLWTWEPLATTQSGTPLLSDGGMWIKLTVLGHTRLGFGDAQGKTGPNATKEIIGDAIRNAAMRFGVGTYLWSKSDAAKAELTRQGVDDEPPADPQPEPEPMVTEAVLSELRRMRVELGVTDAKYAEQLEAVGHVTIDTDLTARAAVRLLATYETRLAATAKPAEPEGDHA